jgi:PHD/YefM family antitoxin component YafN of YafNO toxin-antitoxin module
MVITQNGTAKAVIQDVASYDTTQETLALLKILALGNHQVEQGKVEPLTRVVERLRAQRSGAPFPGNFWRLASANTVRSSSSPSG